MGQLITPIGNEWNPPARAFNAPAPAPAPPGGDGVEWMLLDADNDPFVWDASTDGAVPGVFGEGAEVRLGKFIVERVNPPDDNTITSQSTDDSETEPVVFEWTANLDASAPQISHVVASHQWEITISGSVSAWDGGTLLVANAETGLQLTLVFTNVGDDVITLDWFYNWL